MAAFPNAIFTDSIGASETGFQGIGLQDKGNISTDGPVVALGPTASVIDDDNNVLDPARTSARSAGSVAAATCPVGYYKDPEKSAKTFLTIDGDRYSVPGDFARIEEGSQVTLLGRGSNCVNTGGEKVYPEEVEMAIKGHPAVYDALVVGVPDEKYGQSVAAVVAAARRRRARARGAADVPAHQPLRLQAAARAHDRRGDPAQRHRQGAVPEGQGDRPGVVRRQATHRQESDRCAPRSAMPSASSTRSSRSPRPSTSPPRCRAPAASASSGCVRFNDAEELDQTLTWLDDNTDGKPYGVDVVMPMKIPTEGKSVDLKAMIPEEHMSFVERDAAAARHPAAAGGRGPRGRARLAALDGAVARRRRAASTGRC